VIRSLLLAGAAGIFLAAPVCHAGETVEVSILDYKFNPAELKVSRGTTVKWVNNEKRTAHSVLFLGPEGSESERFFPGESFSRTFDKPGSYPYRCGPHEEMKGRIEVTE
jgi:plastocyanin